MSDEPNLTKSEWDKLARVATALTARQAALVTRCQESIEASGAFAFNLFSLDAGHAFLSYQVDSFLAAMTGSDEALVEVARRGRDFIQAGYLDPQTPGVLQRALTEACLEHWPERRTAKSVVAFTRFSSWYWSVFMESYTEGRQQVVLEHQEGVRRALQRTLEEQQRALTRRAVQMQAVAEVGRSLTSILDLDQLFTSVVELIRDRLQFYHASIFLLDDQGEWAVIQASTGEAGRQLLAQQHKLAVGGRSIVGWVAAEKTPRVVHDVGADSVHFKNPLLPDTHAEAAFPLITHATVIGVLDVQSTELDAFDDDDVASLSTLADQVAVAIQNARLFQRVQDDLNELNRLYREQAAGTWRTLEQIRPEGWGYEYDRFKARPVGPGPEAPDRDSAARQPGVPAPDGDGAETVSPVTLALPLKQRGHVIGMVGFEGAETSGQWSEEDIAVVQAIVPQIVQALENAMLLEQTERRLQEQTLLGEIASTTSATFDQDATLADVARRLVEHFRVDHCGIVLFDEECETMVVVAEYPDQGVLGTVMPARGYPVGDQFLRDQAPLVVNNIHTASRLGPNAELLAELGVNTLALIPIKSENRLIGSIGLDAVDPHYKFNETELALVQAIAAQVATALEKTRLFRQTQEGLRETAVLYRVSRALAQLDNEREMLELVLREYLRHLNLTQGGALIFDEDRVSGTLKAHVVDGELVEPGLRIPVAASPVHQKLIETGQPVVINDVRSDELVEPLREFTLNLGIQSLLLMPIKVRGEVIGALGADATAGLHEFSEREIALVQAMADQLSVSLEKHRLLAETKRRALQLQTATDVGRIITANLELDILMGETVELIRDRFGFDHAQIFLLDGEGKWAVLHKSTGPAGQELLARGHRLAVGSQSVIGQVTAQRKTVIARDVDTDRVHRPNVLLPDTRAEIAIPLQVGDRLIGALDVQSNQPNAFNHDDVLALELLAGQIAVAIENARAFAEQQETAARLREVDRMKTQFLANMSHELRTPLNSIIGFSRVILKGIDGPITELQKTDLTAIYHSGQHLLGLINNILDLSKIEAGKMELNFEEVDLRQILKSVASTAVALVKDKSVELVQDVAEDLPLIYADQTRLRQIVLNLIANAAKFTEEGQISLTARADGDDVLVCVSDTGIGIPPDKLEHIFEEFTQVDASTTRRAGGTGLGLPITRHFVEMHNGTITVQSKEGSGSTFTVRLPLNRASAVRQPEDRRANGAPAETPHRIVMVVDDDEGVITLYQRYLHAQNFHIIGLTDSSNVVERAKEVGPYVILLDILMPGKDGWTVLRELKEDPGTCDIPVIITSIVSARERALSLGATDYLRKPIMASDLLDALNKMANAARRERRVLVVDDQADDLLLIRRVLEAQGNFQVIVASDGVTGLELVHRKRPDLILLDLMMPGMDGFAVVESLKTGANTRAIPIIVVTAKDITPAERDFLNANVEAILHKGIFSEADLMRELGRVFDRLPESEALKLNT